MIDEFHIDCYDSVKQCLCVRPVAVCSSCRMLVQLKGIHSGLNLASVRSKSSKNDSKRISFVCSTLPLFTYSFFCMGNALSDICNHQTLRHCHLRVTEIKRILRSENVGSSQLEQSHGATVCFDSYYSHVLDKQR